MPSPTSLSFAGVSDGVLSFYASTAGREAAVAAGLQLECRETAAGPVPGEGLAAATVQSAGAVLVSATTGVFQQVAQILGQSGRALDLIAPLFTVSVIPGELGGGSAGQEGVVLLADFLPGTGTAVTQGQALRPKAGSSQGETTEKDQPPEARGSSAGEEEPSLPIWERIAMGIDSEWEQVRNKLLQKRGLTAEVVNQRGPAPGHLTSPSPAKAHSPTQEIRDTAPGSRPRSLRPLSSLATTPDRTRQSPLVSSTPHIESLAAEADVEPASLHEASGLPGQVAGRGHYQLIRPIAMAVAVASAATAALIIKAAQTRQRETQGLYSPFLTAR